MDAAGSQELGRWAWLVVVALVVMVALTALAYQLTGPGWASGLIVGGLYSAYIGLRAWRGSRQDVSGRHRGPTRRRR
jgi:hypothetical protein